LGGLPLHPLLGARLQSFLQFLHQHEREKAAENMAANRLVAFMVNQLIYQRCLDAPKYLLHHRKRAPVAQNWVSILKMILELKKGNEHHKTLTG